MRALAHEFSARTRDHTGRQWELRLLPQPLYRYESTDPGVPDGAVFAFVTSAGTDPEVILVVEARKPAGGGEPAWHYAAARFTDLDLWVSHKEKVVFTATYISLGGSTRTASTATTCSRTGSSRRWGSSPEGRATSD